MSVVVKGMEMPTNCLRNMRRIESPLGTGGPQHEENPNTIQARI